MKSWEESLERRLDRLARGESSTVASMRGIVGLVVVLFIFWVLHQLQTKALHASGLDVFLPWSMFRLTTGNWISLLDTAASAIYAFVTALFLAYWLGMGSALLLLRGRFLSKLVSLSINKIYQFFYIVPVVLTITMISGILLKSYANGMSGLILVPALMTASALSIGGWFVFHSVFVSTVSPDRRHEMIVDALFLPDTHRSGAPGSRLAAIAAAAGRWTAPIKRLQRLHDGQSATFCLSVESCWHLSIVAVVIVETVVPGVYAYLAEPGVWGAFLLKNGVGRDAVIALSIVDMSLVMGYMWALFFFDLLGLSIVGLVLRQRYRRHYGEGR